MTNQEIGHYDVGTIPAKSELWNYSKRGKVWIHSVKYFNWLFVFCCFDKDVNLVTEGTHFRYHILNEKNKGMEFDDCPDYVQKEFEYELDCLIKEGIIVKKEDDNNE